MREIFLVKRFLIMNMLILFPDGLIKKDSYLKTQFKEMTSKRVLLPLRLILIVFVFREITTFSAIRPYLIGELNKLHTPINAKLILVSDPWGSQNF